MLRRVALVSTDVSQELSTSETSVHTRATRRNIPEDVTLHSHRLENLMSYTVIHILKIATKTACRWCSVQTVTLWNVVALLLTLA
jgi:hypothetical protein